MRFSEIGLQTLRAAPAEFRSPGSGYLYRAGYVSREKDLQFLGTLTVERINSELGGGSFANDFSKHGFRLIGNMTSGNYFLASDLGSEQILECSNCGFAELVDETPFIFEILNNEPLKEMQKLLTPGCNTISSLAEFLDLPQSKTAKALMYTRSVDQKFIFVVIRGDHQLSECKLKKLIGDHRMATVEEINAVGAVPGYASPIGLKDVTVIVDSVVLKSQNLAAGANDIGYHLLNTNAGRDYEFEISADLALAGVGNACPTCGGKLNTGKGYFVVEKNDLRSKAVLDHIAEENSDAKGLLLPKAFAPFSIYLMNIPGTTVDTAAIALSLYEKIQLSGISVLLDDRNERAGVKFADADLIGCPIRVTVGERGMLNNDVELKLRNETESIAININAVLPYLQSLVIGKE